MTANWLTAPRAPRSEAGAVSEMYTGTAIETTPTATPESRRPARMAAKELSRPMSSHAAMNGSADDAIASLRPAPSASGAATSAPSAAPTLTIEPKSDASVDETAPSVCASFQLTVVPPKTASKTHEPLVVGPTIMGRLDGDVKPSVYPNVSGPSAAMIAMNTATVLPPDFGTLSAGGASSISCWLPPLLPMGRPKGIPLREDCAERRRWCS